MVLAGFSMECSLQMERVSRRKRGMTMPEGGLRCACVRNRRNARRSRSGRTGAGPPAMVGTGGIKRGERHPPQGSGALRTGEEGCIAGRGGRQGRGMPPQVFCGGKGATKSSARHRARGDAEHVEKRGKTWNLLARPAACGRMRARPSVQSVEKGEMLTVTVGRHGDFLADKE